MLRIRADLHLHTCLSPCGGYDVTPAAVVTQAARLGLGLIAITDHNSAENLAPALETARRLGQGAPRVLAGLEVTTREEVHLLTLFPRLAEALTMQAMVYQHLQPGCNRPDIFGDQVVANAEDEVEYLNPRLLIGATDLDLEQVARRAHGLGGLVIAAHLDRPSFSIVSQLGIIPSHLDLDGVEISPLNDPAQAARWLGERRLPVTTSSDAHRLEDLGRVWTELRVRRASFDELALALAGRKGRAVLGWGRRPG